MRSFHFLLENARPLAKTPNLEHLLDEFESSLNLHIAVTTRRWLFVHAGVIEWNGCAVLIPGRSYSGKTTLVQEFIKAGASYYSDEFAILDERGRVHPSPAALAVRGGAPGMSRVRPEILGAKIGSDCIPVGLVLLTRFRPGGRWRPKPATSGSGVLALLANTLVARNRPLHALGVLENTVRKARILQGPRGEAREVVESALRQLSRQQPDS
jgi:hypothetical protein